MDIRALSNPRRISASRILVWFAMSTLGIPGERKSLLKELKHPWSPFATLATEQKWRKRLSRRIAESEQKVEQFLRQELENQNAIAALNQMNSLAERNEGSTAPVSWAWLKFEQLAEDLKKNFQEPKVTIYFDFLESLALRKLDFEELMMWMLCAYRESPVFMWTQYVEDGHGIDDLEPLVPLECWIPQSHDERLCTTRYRVFDHLITQRCAVPDDRNKRHLRGGPRWRSSKCEENFRELATKKAVVTLWEDLKREDNAQDSGAYVVLFHLAGFYEQVQLTLFANGVSSERIEASFSRLPEIRTQFLSELRAFATEHIK